MIKNAKESHLRKAKGEKLQKEIVADLIEIFPQHAENIKLAELQEAVRAEIIAPILPEEWLHSETKYHINPTGQFVIGGPVGDCGLTGRKIIVDSYGGMARHGGGAFSGKDPSKVDRSAAYASRHMAKNLVAAGVADEILVQLSYAIGVVEPTSVYVNTYGTAKVDLTDAEIADKAKALFDLRPYAIEQRLKLRNPMYLETASYGHMGRTPRTITKTFESPYNGKVSKEVALFTWEQLDHVETIKNSFKL